ncbi:MAG: hypothetical protein A3J48_00750 [Candidatus Doudnabacteria bacterium RIFCSPHIGHO2_02_FULL_46_11]|uniref:SHS2 domain-containing protein n=1 Tax=Candidatus Doudnabacteria bacterium RIFCSPHIGHO2_02_FULL_46_11 TaxID=1817832 RepID=A0A1F5P926_9BACT|nr:MAG: hypothetical protein A3J48_00750 [Candidatus Doudnabacteria bacterium RIFCSPHIGHO2_02_FULL_46_11]
MFAFGKKNLVGLDIGTTSVKVVELSRTGGHFQLETYGIAQIKADTEVPDGVSPLDVTITTVKELFNRTKVKSKRIVASLPTSTVFVAVIEVPKVKESEQQKAIEFEARKIIPIPLEDVTVSWNSLPPDQGTDSSKQSVLLTAVPNHVISNYITVFKALGLSPQAIEVEATALIRSLIGQDTSTALVIDVGTKTSTVNLIDRGYLYFSKNINVGGETISKSVAQILNVNFVRAEQFKKSLGLSGLSDFKNIPAALRPSLDLLKTEIEQVLNLSQGRGRSVEKMILTGGGAKLLGLDQYLTSSFNVPVTIGNPWARVVVPKTVEPLVHELGSGLAVCVGLAMRQED